METHCISRDYLIRLIEIELEGKDFLEEETLLKHLLEDWKNWETELICLASSLLQILENRQKKSENASLLLKKFRSLYEDRGFLLEVEKFNQPFIEYMFGFVRQPDLTIEDNLLEIRQNLAECNYR